MAYTTKRIFFTTLCAISTTFLSLTPLMADYNSGMDTRSDRPYRKDDRRDAQYIDRINKKAFYFLGDPKYTLNGNLRLHDSSEWTIRDKKNSYYGLSMRQIVSGWDSKDQILIKPNKSYTDIYVYILHNRTKREVVEVGLVLPPVPNGKYSRVIECINYDTNEVQLNNGLIFKINPRNTNFKKWKIGHPVLIAVNSDWRSGKYPHILINAGLAFSPYCEADVR